MYIDTAEAISIIYSCQHKLERFAKENGKDCVELEGVKTIFDYLTSEIIKSSRPYPWGSNNLGEEK